MRSVADRLLLAIEHHRAWRYAMAEALYAEVLAAEPRHAQTSYLYGLLLLDTGRSREAVVKLRDAAVIWPRHPGILAHLARALLSDEQPEPALATIDSLAAVDPANAQTAFLRGTALNALGEPSRSIAAFEQAIARDPMNAAAFLNLGNAHAELDRLDAAEGYCRQALAVDPRLAEAHASLGFILTSLGRLDEAIAACEAAIALRPHFAQAHWNLAVAALLAGNFRLGFHKYEWRKRHDRFRRDFIDLPGQQWDGTDPAGRTILVHAEQGFGDTIQFARYLPLIAAHGGRPILACERPLIPLLARMRDVEVVPKDTELPNYDHWLDQMSLPRVFGTRVDTIPLASGYLQADPARVTGWRAALPPGPNVGIAWAGNPAHNNDRRRSLPVAALSDILAAPGINFVNLQVGPRSRDSPLADLSSSLVDFAETAALMTALDLVLTVDTAVAHVAGAIGQPTWLMLPHAPDWRWLLGRSDTPWYASLRLFRQPTAGDWGAVAAAVVASLAGWRNQGHA